MRKKDERRFFGITVILIVIGFCFMGLSKYYNRTTSISGDLLDNPTVSVPQEEEQKAEPKKEKVYVNVFFIGQNANKEEVYKAVNREYDESIDGSKIKFAINALIMGPKSEEKAKGVYKSNFAIERRNMSQTLDLRGYRADEALDEVEAYLDKASLVNLTPVYIIHGHGTGALKQVIRDYLMNSPYVAKFRAGEAAEGGDGVSVVDIA